MNNELKYWLAFDQLTGAGLGTKRILALYDFFGSLETAWQADEQDLKASKVINDKVIRDFVLLRKNVDIELSSTKLARYDIKVINYIDSLYPQQLKSLRMPPLLLYYKGVFDQAIQDQAVGIVGTRDCSEYAYDMTLHLAEQLSNNDCTIITGLARGIDSASIIGALQGQKKAVIAVVANGVDKIVPYSNKKLYEAILENNGCILSEYPPETEPHKGFFPARNRLIAALSQGIVVAEAPAKSGALITAEYAYELTKPVFAMAGHAFNQKNEGNHNWLKSGKAKFMTDSTDILTSLKVHVISTDMTERLMPLITLAAKRKDLPAPQPIVEEKSIPSLESILDLLSDQESKDIITLLYENNHCLQFDHLVEKSLLSISKLNSLLLKLKLKKIIEQNGTEVKITF